MWHSYHAPGSVDEALALLAHYGDACRVIAGGTDLILELERGVRPQQVLVDISRIAALDAIHSGADGLTLGALASHSRVVASPDAVARAFPLARACWLVGAPQIRNRGTVAGNLVTASPANDTITPLWALDATVTLASRARGERTLAFDAFFQGVRRTALQPDELLVRIDVPALKPTERGTFLKLGLRRAQAISIVNVAAVVDFAGATVRRARIALGAVAPTIIRAAEAEAYLAGRALDEETIDRAAALAAAAARPISDIRGSAEYRRDMARVLVGRALQQLADGTERAGWPEQPVLLRRAQRGPAHPPPPGEATGPITFNLNGRPVTLPAARGKTLLRALREDAGLTGAKEGCAEGECGACTVWLDGAAVMSCLVPAERAAGCDVVTIEGLTPDAALHPLQQAFIDAGAVQCGYCTPGLIMSAGMLLEEVAHPTPDQIKEALTGNLCRCTGYYKILEAVDRAASPPGD
ncbi:MAG: Nicotinate dehydrogenase small FeS subunit [Chloroflexi bacterium ADurb.Bin325]|nr:MAG: Nicotinate dehydrogenase small FeS subunit [Chloroflexi bacterium ADurb.Bin325]